MAACAAPPAAGYTVRTLTNAAGEPIRFERPEGLAFDGEDNLFVAEWTSGNIIRVSPEGQVTPLLSDDTLSLPEKLTVGADGSLYVTESAANRVVQVGADGSVRVVAGSSVDGFADGAAAEAQFFRRWELPWTRRARSTSGTAATRAFARSRPTEA